MAGGADVILLPEIEHSAGAICEYLISRREKGKPYSIVVTAEGVRTGTDERPARYLSRLINETTGLEARETVLGYIQRGGVPCAVDRILATRLGARAARLIAKRRFGFMTALRKGKIIDIPLAETAGRIKYVPADHNLIKKSRGIGTSFGD